MRKKARLFWFGLALGRLVPNEAAAHCFAGRNAHFEICRRHVATIREVLHAPAPTSRVHRIFFGFSQADLQFADRQVTG